MEELNVWERDNLVFYLSVYYSDKPNWVNELEKLRGKNKGAEITRKHIAYTILAPYMLKMRATDPAEALLFVCFKFDNFNDMDWASELQIIFEKDQVIKGNRKQLLSSIISPVEYHSKSRQALKWLYEEASNDPTIDESNKTDTLQRLRNLILLYGPSAICSIFQRPEIKASFFSKSINWRTGYFVEHALYENFTFEQLLEMKQRDLDSAPLELIKHFGEAEKTDPPS